MFESKLFVQVVLSIIVILSFFLSIQISKRVIKNFSRKYNFNERRVFYVNKIITMLFLILFLLLVSIIWGFDIKGLPIFFASFFGLVGIAFFASWSILSNITASLIIFFSYQIRITDKIKIIDGDNSVTGVIKDMTMFTIILESEEDNTTVTYPNNIILQKPVLLIKQG